MWFFIRLCSPDLGWLSSGLLCGILASFYSKEMTRILRGDSNAMYMRRLIHTSCASTLTTSLRGAMFTMAQKRFYDRLSRRAYQATLAQPLAGRADGLTAPSSYPAHTSADRARRGPPA